MKSLVRVVVASVVLFGCASGEVVVRTQAPTIPTTTYNRDVVCDDGFCIRPGGGPYPEYDPATKGVLEPNDGVLSGGLTGPELDALYAGAIDVDPVIATTSTSTVVLTTTTTTVVAVASLYRARNGDVARGEVVSRIFVERSVVEATAQLGISDLDPDGDGWSLVGRTNGDGDNGPLARFFMVGSVPHVTTRHAQKGCLELVPRSLGRVSSGQTRLMDEFAQNTANCRAAAPGADTDANGIADNVQPLYRARNGDTARGESAARVYLERSLVASEATIGISDYDPDGDSWALVGRTNGASDDGVAGPVVMSGSAPYVSVRKANGTCVKITPVSLLLVSRGQTRLVTSSPC